MCLLQFKDIDIAKYKFHRFQYPCHYRYRHSTSSFHARWSVAVPYRRMAGTSPNPLATLTENWYVIFQKPSFFFFLGGGGFLCRDLRWRWSGSGCGFLSNFDASHVKLVLNTPTRLQWLPEESILHVEVWCLHIRFNRCEWSWISRPDVEREGTNCLYVWGPTVLKCPYSRISRPLYPIYVSWRCRNCLSSWSSECPAICSCWRKDSITPQLPGMAGPTFELKKGEGGGGFKEKWKQPRRVYKIHIWTIKNSSGPHQVINTDWSLNYKIQWLHVGMQPAGHLSVVFLC